MTISSFVNNISVAKIQKIVDSDLAFSINYLDISVKNE